MVTIHRIDRTVIPGVSRPTLADAPVSRAGENIAGGLNAVADMAQTWQDTIDEADATDADARFTQSVNDLLTNPDTGFLHQRGANATTAYQSAQDELDRMRREMLDGMSPNVRSMAEQSLSSRYDAAIARMNDHFVGEAREYRLSAGEARISASVQSAVALPDQAELQLSAAMVELRSMAQSEGWAPEVLAQKEAEVASQTYSQIVAQMASRDPVAAQAFLEGNRNRLLPTEAERLTQTLLPMVSEARGRALGAAAAAGQSIAASEVVEAGNGYTVVRLADGQEVRREGTRAWRNNNPGNIEYGDFAVSMGAVGTDGRFAVFPTYEAGRAAMASLLFESNSYRGLSIADAISRYAPAFENDTGSYISQVARAAGVSPDTVMSTLSPSQRELMLTAMERVEGYRVGSETGGSSTGHATMDGLLSISDPLERDAAIAEYDLRMTVATRERQERERNATDTLFQIIEGGGSVSDLDLETRTALAGDVLAQARQYERSVAAGVPIQTDDQFYVDLRQRMGSDPQGFLAENPMSWRNSLSDSHFQWFVEQQAQMRSGTGGVSASDVSSVMSLAKARLDAAGITQKDSPANYASVQSQLIRWADQNQNLASQPAEVDRYVSQLMTPVILDRRGFGNKIDTQAGLIDFDGQPGVADDMTVQDVFDATLKINGVEVPFEDKTAFIEGYRAQFNRDPLASEFVNGLVASGIYN